MTENEKLGDKALTLSPGEEFEFEGATTVKALLELDGRFELSAALPELRESEICPDSAPAVSGLYVLTASKHGPTIFFNIIHSCNPMDLILPRFFLSNFNLFKFNRYTNKVRPISNLL